MLKTKLLHPEILEALGKNGHGARVLIADGNYPFSTGVGASAKKVFLNFSPGVLNVVDVLSVLADTIPLESAHVMQPADDSSPEIHGEFNALLGDDFPVIKLKRFDFYDLARQGDTCLVIATAEKRRFSNILLTIGVIK